MWCDPVRERLTWENNEKLKLYEQWTIANNISKWKSYKKNFIHWMKEHFSLAHQFFLIYIIQRLTFWEAAEKLPVRIEWRKVHLSLIYDISIMKDEVLISTHIFICRHFESTSTGGCCVPLADEKNISENIKLSSIHRYEFEVTIQNRDRE